MIRAGPLDGWYPHAPPRVAHDISAPGKHLSMQLGLGMALGAYYSSPRPWGGAFWFVTRSMDGVSTCHHSMAPVKTTGGAAVNAAPSSGDLTTLSSLTHDTLTLTLTMRHGKSTKSQHSFLKNPSKGLLSMARPMWRMGCACVPPQRMCIVQ